MIWLTVSLTIVFRVPNDITKHPIPLSEPLVATILLQKYCGKQLIIRSTCSELLSVTFDGTECLVSVLKRWECCVQNKTYSQIKSSIFQNEEIFILDKATLPMHELGSIYSPHKHRELSSVMVRVTVHSTEHLGSILGQVCQFLVNFNLLNSSNQTKITKRNSNDFPPIRTVDRVSVRSKVRRRKETDWWEGALACFLAFRNSAIFVKTDK